MKCNAVLFFLLALAVQCSGQPVDTLPRVTVLGNRFMVEGKVVQFRGLDASDPDKLEKDGHWNKEYFSQVKSWGANLVRFPVHPRAWRSRGKEAYLRLLDSGIVWARELGLYVNIDWHSIGNLQAEQFQSAGYFTTKRETFDFWRMIARRYQTETTVAFFELFNEPTTMEGKLGSCSWEEWKSLNEAMIDTIRAEGAKAIPLVAGFNWAYDLTPVATNPINAEGIGYVSHPYPMKRPKPWIDQWTKDWGFVGATYPLMLTEIGFCGAEERGAHVPVIGDESYGEAITAYCDSTGISYSVWVFDPQWSPMLIGDWSFKPTRQGRYFRKVMQARARIN